MMLWKNRSVSVGLLFVAICTLSGVVFSGCCPASGNKAGQAAPSKEGTTVKPADKPTEKPAEPAAKPAKPQAMLVEPAGKIGSDAGGRRPKVSTFAPAADLASQADQYIKDLEKAVASEEEYKDSVEKIAKESNTLVVIALALGLHDQPSKYKASAGAVLKAAQAVAATKDFASARKAIAALKAAAEGQGKADVEAEMGEGRRAARVDEAGAGDQHEAEAEHQAREVQEEGQGHGGLHGGDRGHCPGVDGRHLGHEERRPGEAVAEVLGGDARRRRGRQRRDSQGRSSRPRTRR